MPDNRGQPKGKRKMTWLLIIGGVLVALVAIPFVVGMTLSAPFEFKADRTINYPPEAVWAAPNDFQSILMSGRQCRGTESIESEGGLLAWREDMGPSVATIETLESDEPRRVVRRLSDSVVPMTMRCEYTITPTENGCKLSVVVDGTIERGTWHVPLFRFTVKVLGMGQERPGELPQRHRGPPRQHADGFITLT